MPFWEMSRVRYSDGIHVSSVVSAYVSEITASAKSFKC
ncbi:hypothetical protein MASSI9I_90326 [Massilia sp. 9I]|nr:hypothetical protein MASSI9I_90326 [Massilia sp. 9I]